MHMMLVLVREVMNEYFPLPVEHVPHDLLPCANQAQGACSGDTKVVHGLATHELADAGAQHCPTISHAGVGRPACTLHPLCQHALNAVPRLRCISPARNKVGGMQAIPVTSPWIGSQDLYRQQWCTH